MVCHSLDVKESNLSLEPDNNATLIPETVAFCSDPISDENKKAQLSCAGDFLSFANWEKNTLRTRKIQPFIT